MAKMIEHEKHSGEEMTFHFKIPRKKEIVEGAKGYGQDALKHGVSIAQSLLDEVIEALEKAEKADKAEKAAKPAKAEKSKSA